VAVRVSGDATPANNGLFYLLTDHLGSTSITANGTTGALVSEMRYKPWGETRWSSGTTPTSKHFTGQIEDSYIKLIQMGARWYDAEIGRFISADTIVPQVGNPQALNRFSYVKNNPLRYTDPTGHTPCHGDNWEDGPKCVTDSASRWHYDNARYQRQCGGCNGLLGFVLQAITMPEWTIATAVRDTIYSELGIGTGSPASVSMGTVSQNSEIPRGFQSSEEFDQFGNTLYGGVGSAGYDDVTAILQGSSVTGVKYTTGKPFDVGRVSDYDIALASPSLLDRARELGIGLRSGGTRTGPLTAPELEQLGLSGVAGDLSQMAGRPVNFMVFQSAEVAMSRSPSIVLPGYGYELGPLDVEPFVP
jgi:RHS repeat-associated protein